jgi:hypothetical protein
MTDTVLIIPEKEIVVLQLPDQGPSGPQGPPGESGGDTERVTVTKVASHPISGHRLICADNTGRAVYASHSDTLTTHRVLGLSTHAAAFNTNVQILSAGEITDDTWDWDTDLPVFLGLNGLLTQTMPTYGAILPVAFPVTSQTLRVKIGEPVYYS